MAQALASIDLRSWALAGVALLVLQTGALQAMDEQPLEPSARGASLTAALLTVIFVHCARAYARAKRAQAIGNDIPTG